MKGIFLGLRKLRPRMLNKLTATQKVRARMGWGPMLPASHGSLCARPRVPLGTNTSSRDREFLSKEQSTLLALLGLISKCRTVSRRPSGSDLMVFNPAAKILAPVCESRCIHVAGSSGHPKTLDTMNLRTSPACFGLGPAHLLPPQSTMP